jgi:transposase-like protein
MLRRLRLAETGETETCVHCESNVVVERGTTGKDAQQYWCKECETYSNDLTNTIFGQHRFELEEMFYTVKEMRSEPTAQIARDLDRDYEAVLDFVHKIQDMSGNIDEFGLYDVCEADEVYVTAGEKGLEDEDGSPRWRGLSKKDAETSNQTSHQYCHSSVGMTDEFDFWSARTSKTLTKTSQNTATGV